MVHVSTPQHLPPPPTAAYPLVGAPHLFLNPLRRPPKHARASRTAAGDKAAILVLALLDVVDTTVDTAGNVAELRNRALAFLDILDVYQVKLAALPCYKKVVGDYKDLLEVGCRRCGWEGSQGKGQVASVTGPCMPTVGAASLSVLTPTLPDPPAAAPSALPVSRGSSHTRRPTPAAIAWCGC